MDQTLLKSVKTIGDDLRLEGKVCKTPNDTSSTPFPQFPPVQAVACNSISFTFGSDRLAPPGFSFSATATRTFQFGPRLH